MKGRRVVVTQRQSVKPLTPTLAVLAILASAMPVQADLWGHVPGGNPVTDLGEPPVEVSIHHGSGNAACPPDDYSCICTAGQSRIVGEGPTDLNPDDGELKVPIVPDRDWLYVCANF